MAGTSGSTWTTRPARSAPGPRIRCNPLPRVCSPRRTRSRRASAAVAAPAERPAGSAPGRPESSGPALARGQLADLCQVGPLDALDHELGDALPAGEGLRARIVVDEQYLDLAAVAGVDEPGRVEHRHPVPEREPRARQHEARIAAGNGARDPRRH